MKYLPLFHHFKAIYQFPKHIICLVNIVANAGLKEKNQFHQFLVYIPLNFHGGYKPGLISGPYNIFV